MSDWHDEPPMADGDFYYSGKTPNGTDVIAIVHVCTTPKGARRAYLFMPPYWRGDPERVRPAVHGAPLADWHGQWSGPDYGLTTIGPNAELSRRHPAKRDDGRT